MGRVLDHVDIRVSDRDASQRFYEIVSDGQPVARHLHIEAVNHNRIGAS